MLTALIDGDVIAYRAAAAVQSTTDWGDGLITSTGSLNEATDAVESMLEDISERLSADAVEIALTATEGEYRKALYPRYKANRDPAKKPPLLSAVKQYLIDQHSTRVKPKIEADDVLGIMATHPRWAGEKVIVTVDKDLKQIPGMHFNPWKSEGLGVVSPELGEFLFLTQVLTGDTVDNYPGCPGIGPVKADRLLEDIPHALPEMLVEGWKRIVEAYTAKKLTEQDALTQAHVARILRAGEYDMKNGEPILWSPPN